MTELTTTFGQVVPRLSPYVRALLDNNIGETTAKRWQIMSCCPRDILNDKLQNTREKDRPDDEITSAAVRCEIVDAVLK